jgi:YidC/Oxa1 family membrane protein insertase
MAPWRSRPGAAAPFPLGPEEHRGASPVLNFIYYPVSFILWVWHEVFGFLLGPDNGIAWALSVMFLVFTLRAILYKPFVHQVRSMRRMQEFQPEIAKLRKKYANDKQKQAEEMQRLQKEHGVNPLGGCLPVLVQVPVFIGLFHVLREFGPTNNDGSPRTENYFFGLEEVQSFNRSDLFGAKLGNWVLQGEQFLNAAGTSVASMLIVMIPLMIAAGIFTHITARHSVARQTAAQAENPQTAIMNRLMLYIFPIGVVVGAPFLPLAVLLYWVSNNLWTLGQQYVVYRRIDVEESAKREQAEVTRQARAPRPGQKPVRPEAPVEEPKQPAKRPGAKPITRKPAGSGSNGAAPKTEPAGTSSTDAPTDAPGDGDTSLNGSKGGAVRGARSGGGSRPPARRPRKRR